MADEIDALLARMFRNIYARCEDIARKVVIQQFGSNLRGGKLDGSAIGGLQSVSPAVLPIATTAAVGVLKPDGTTITVNPITGLAAAAAGTGPSDATPTVTGVVAIDRSPASGHPVALTAPRLGAPDGIAALGGDGLVPSFEIPGQAGSIAQAGRWTRSTGNPILPRNGSISWEAYGPAEPSVLFDGGLYKLWYVGTTDGTEAHTAVGYATCPGTADPTNPANWTRSASNPVIPAPALEPNVIVLPGGGYRMWYRHLTDLLVANSPDGITWTAAGTALLASTLGTAQVDKTTVWFDGTLWQMLLEGGGPTMWAIYHATSTDGLHFTPDGFGALTSLSQGGTYGGVQAANPPKRNGRYHIWYHAATSGATPLDLYHATSTDLQHWTPDGPILSHTANGLEDDFLYNPAILEVYGTSYLIYAGSPDMVHAAICAASIAGTLATIADGSSMSVGTVTSVALTVPGILSVSGSPITSSGTLAVSLATQSANTGFFGPTSGGAATPTFRALVAGDYVSMVGDSGAGGVRGAVPAPAAGDGAAGKYLSAGGTWQAPAAGVAVVWSPLLDPATPDLLLDPTGDVIMAPA